MLEILNTTLAWLLGWLLIWQAYILIFNRDVSNIKTAPAIRKKIIEALQADQKTKHKENYTIIDLGSENGNFSRDIAHAMPEAKVVGLEISRWSVW